MGAFTRNLSGKYFLGLLFGISICLITGLAGCGSSQPPQPQQTEQGPKRFHLEGRVVSVNPASQKVEVDHGDIPGFMSAMKMGYSVKDPNLLTPLSKDDQIKADVVVNGDDVHLENIVVTKKAAPSNSSGGQTPPASSQPGK